jgi:hypothetical protein
MVESTILVPHSDEKFIPSNAIDFEPLHAHIFLSASNGTVQRLTFTDMPMIDLEKKHCEGFAIFCNEKGLSIPETYMASDNMLVRYLQATKWDY